MFKACVNRNKNRTHTYNYINMNLNKMCRVITAYFINDGKCKILNGITNWNINANMFE